MDTNKGPVLFSRPAAYEGGYPGLPEGSMGDLTVQDGSIHYAGQRKKTKTKDDPVVITGDAVEDVRYVPNSRVRLAGAIEIDALIHGEAFTAKFQFIAMNPEKEAQKFIQAVQSIRAGSYRSGSEFNQDGRAPYQLRHVSGLPNSASGQTARLKVYDHAIFIWRARKGLTSTEFEWSYEIPLKELRSARIESGERLVAMRILTTGLFGLLWKKKDKFLVLEWDDPARLNVPLVLSFNGADRALAEIQRAKTRLGSSGERAGSEASESPAAKIRELKQLLDEGIITEAEFSAKKAELLSDF